MRKRRKGIFFKSQENMPFKLFHHRNKVVVQKWRLVVKSQIWSWSRPFFKLHHPEVWFFYHMRNILFFHRMLFPFFSHWVFYFYLLFFISCHIFSRTLDVNNKLNWSQQIFMKYLLCATLFRCHPCDFIREQRHLPPHLKPWISI